MTATTALGSLVATLLLLVLTVVAAATALPVWVAILFGVGAVFFCTLAATYVAQLAAAEVEQL